MKCIKIVLKYIIGHHCLLNKNSSRWIPMSQTRCPFVSHLFCINNSPMLQYKKREWIKENCLGISFLSSFQPPSSVKRRISHFLINGMNNVRSLEPKFIMNFMIYSCVFLLWQFKMSSDNKGLFATTVDSHMKSVDPDLFLPFFSSQPYHLKWFHFCISIAPTQNVLNTSSCLLL